MNPGLYFPLQIWPQDDPYMSPALPRSLLGFMHQGWHWHPTQCWIHLNWRIKILSGMLSLLKCFSILRKLLIFNCIHVWPNHWLVLIFHLGHMTVDFYHPFDIYQWSEPRIIVETRLRDEEKEWSEPGSKSEKMKGVLVLPQEVRRQRIQMTGVKEKENPYRKHIERESGLQRGLKKREKVGEPLQRKKWEGKITNTGARTPTNRSRWTMHGACGDRFYNLIVFRVAFTPPCIFFLKSKPSLSTLTQLHSAFCVTSIFLKKLSSLHSSPSLQMPSLFLT